MNRRINENTPNKVILDKLIDIMQNNDSSNYDSVLTMLEGINICNFRDRTGEILELLETMKEDTNDYRLKALIINILTNNLSNLVEYFTDRYDMDFSEEDVDYVTVNYGKIKIDKKMCYKLFDEYIDVLKYYFNEDIDYYDKSFPYSMDFTYSDITTQLDNFTCFGLNNEYKCKKIIEVFEEDRAFRYILKNCMCSSCKNSKCTIYQKYDKEIRMKYRMYIIGSFICTTRPELGKMLDYTSLSLFDFTYYSSVSDMYDYLRYSEVGLEMNAINERESRIFLEIYNLHGRLMHNEITETEIEEEYKKLYKEFFNGEDVFDVICRLP